MKLIMPKRFLTIFLLVVCVTVFTLVISCNDFLPQKSVEIQTSNPKPPILAGGSGGSSNGETSDDGVSPITGNEGTWYQIFVWSYYDEVGKNGTGSRDGMGDLKGITKNLNHLGCKLNDPDHLAKINAKEDCNKSMHVRGIWLTPIMPAPSYHRYDTTDYMSIEPEIGTMADFDDLVAECHSRGINIILDLAINHTGPGHRWFQEALKEWRSGNLGKYAAYYNIRASDSKPNGGSGNWHSSYAGANPGNAGKTPDGKQLWFEGGFGPWMPELNWNSGALMQEFEDIMRFWLIDHKVDGFRLDATKHIFENGSFGSGDTNKNVEYWKWFADTARSIKPTVFMVGETIDGEGTILEYHRPGMSSFAFPFSEREGRIAQAALHGRGKFFADGVVWWDREIKSRSIYATSTPLLTNHDHDRSSQWFTADDHRKFAASLLLLMPGQPFIYYGDEIGLKGWKQSNGTAGHDDKWVRGPMIFQWTGSGAATGRPMGPPNENGHRWGVSLTANSTEWGGIVANPSGHGRPIWEARGGVAEQLTNSDSLLRHYIKIQNMKNRYPWIAWGKIDTAGIDVDGNGQVGAYRVTDDDPRSKTYGESVVIAHNADRRTDREGYIKVSSQTISSGNSIGRPDLGEKPLKKKVVKYEATLAKTDDEFNFKEPVRASSSLGEGVFWLKAYTTVIFVEGYEELSE